jgi:thymidylate synthase
MALPPCHITFQFCVREGVLSYIMTQRSCDVGLGMPFNIASCALPVHLVAYTTELTPGELVLSLGDVHAYRNHDRAILEQLLREPYPFTNVHIADDAPGDLFSILPPQVTISDDKCHKKLPMAITVYMGDAGCTMDAV